MAINTYRAEAKLSLWERKAYSKSATDELRTHVHDLEDYSLYAHD